MKQLFFLFLLMGVFGGPVMAQQMPQYKADDIQIPFTKYTLPNGLRLVVHEDHKAPIVAVNVWYHVGSKNEKLGKSGFAHLFEHLMFNGSENFNTDYFKALEAIGATNLNGTTNDDRTNYFQNIPVSALDQVLWLESDRMGHLLGAIDQAKLDEQRGVVQNEKRQGENQPYSKEYDLFTQEMYPPHHPYGHTVIGSMDDLNAAALKDVQEWFKTYYGAANAVIVIAGDVNPDDVFNKVKKYFGDIPSGPTLSRYETSIPKKTGEVRISYQDRVPESKVSFSFYAPQWGTYEGVLMDIVSDVLSNGKNSRLYKTLVYEKQICTNVYAYNWQREISGNFGIDAFVKPGVTNEEVEKAIKAILADFLKNGPTQEEMQRVNAAFFASFIKGLERIGGFGGKSDILAESEVYGGSPDYYKTMLKFREKATAKEVLEEARKWLSDGLLVMTCTPFPTYTTEASTVDRKKVPEVGATAAAKFPALQRTTLKNGMKVLLAQRSGSPTVSMSTMFDAGYSADKTHNKPGLASLTSNMLDEGTKNLNSLQINEKLFLLGADIRINSDLDFSYVNMSTLKQSLDQSLDLYSEIITQPAFPESEFNRLKEEQLSSIRQEKEDPFGVAMRIMPQYIYGKDHPYGMPWTGTGDEASVKSIKMEDIRKFYQSWLKPNNATLLVTGDISMAELTALLEKKFGSWQKGDVPKKVIPDTKPNNTNKIVLIDRPESQQSVIIGGYLVNKYGMQNETAVELMNNVLGGDFTSRINMNIREDKHWSYGAGAFLQDTRSQRPYLFYAPVQTDKTKESLQEVQKEMNLIVKDKPITEEEFLKTQKNTVMGLPGTWETNGAVNRSLMNIVKYGLKDDYYQTYDASVRNLKTQDVNQIAKSFVKPMDMGWLLTGDKAKILPSLKELGMEIIEVDNDGNAVVPVKTKS